MMLLSDNRIVLSERLRETRNWLYCKKEVIKKIMEIGKAIPEKLMSVLSDPLVAICNFGESESQCGLRRGMSASMFFNHMPEEDILIFPSGVRNFELAPGEVSQSCGTVFPSFSTLDSLKMRPESPRRRGGIRNWE